MKNEFRFSLIATYEMYNKDISDAFIALFCKVLEASGISYTDAMQALEKHIVDPTAGKYPPKPADIVQQIKGNDNSGYKAWEHVLKACKTQNAVYTGVVFSDLKITEAIKMLGGWIQFYEDVQHSLRVNDPWVRKNFIDVYKTATGQTKQIAEGRGMNGKRIAPIQIGNPESCAVILAASRQLESKAELPAIQAATL